MTNRSWLDLSLAVVLLACAVLVGYQQHLLQRSYERETEMFVLANRLDLTASDWERAAGQYKLAAEHFRKASTSCLAAVQNYRAVFDNTTTMMPQREDAK